MSAFAFSDYFEAQIINWFKGTSIVAAPATLYIGLLTTAPGDTGTAGAPSDGTEVSGGSYARVAVTSASGWSAVSASGTTQQISNGSAINFPTPTASWGTVVAIGIYDALTAGHLIAYCAQSPSQTISSGNTVSIAGGALVVQCD